MGRKSSKILKLPPRPIFGFAVEGDCEYDYLKIVLNVSNPHKVKNVQGGSEVVCVRQALDLLGNSEDTQIQKYGTHAYQHVFVVFDTDTMTQQKINDIRILLAKNKKHSQKLKFIVSNQCFEYVLSLHFEPNKNTLPKINANKPKILMKHGYKNHKSNPTRTRLMTDLKNAPDNCRAMYTALKSREKTLQFNACTHWVERIKSENDSNSNFYVVYDCLASHNLLPEALKPLE
jgi:hypothetical protein